MVSFRSRIRSSTLALIAGLLVIFSTLLYLSLSALLSRHIDGSLLALARAEAAYVEAETGQLAPDARAHQGHGEDDDDEGEASRGDRDHEVLEAIRSSIVLGPGGEEVWRGGAVVDYLPSPEGALSEALRGRIVYETISSPAGTSFRRILFPLLEGGNVRYVLQTQTSLALLEETLRWLVIALAGVAALSLCLAWYGSGWVAREALSPVRTLSATASRISGQTLGTRLSLDAPYEEFQGLAQSFNNMLERLQRVFDAQRRFVADAAHELKTPLTAIKGTLEVTLQKTRSPEAYRDALIATLSEVERLISLSRSLLTLTHLAGDRPRVSFHPVQLAPLLEEVVGDLTALAEDRGVRIVADARGARPVLGERGQLRQVLINLLDNALRHTPAGGTVTARVGEESGEVRLEVQDTGEGIADQDLPHIFERFYRADRARDRASGGAGLGLAIVQEIVQAHGGRVEVQSRVGKGASFAVILPVAGSSTGLPNRP